MLKYLLMGASSLFSLGLMVHQDEPKPPVGENAVANQEAAVQDVLLTLSDTELENPASSLRTAYVLLRQLREARLEDKPKALADRAVVLYLSGIKALHLGDVAAAEKLGSASLELAQAVELTRVAPVGGDEGELPAPPVITFTLAEGDKGDGPQEVVLDMPPRINGEVVIDSDGPADSKSIKLQGTAVNLLPQQVKGQVVYVLRSDDAAPNAAFITQDGKEKREFVVKSPANTVSRQVFAFAPKVVRGTWQATDDGAQARQELQAAYAKIRAARAKYKGAETKIYLDSARDLYNAARKEAEAGRNARALELTRAAVALVRVPTLLDEGKEARKTETREVRIERRAERKDQRKEALEEKKEEKKYRIHVVPRTDEHGQIELRLTPGEEKKAERQAKGRVRIETRTRTIGPDGKPHDEVKVEEHDLAQGEKPEAEAHAEARVDDAGPVVGVGLVLSVEDDNVVVRGLVPGGPAQQEGSIKEGDRLIGVEPAQGDVVKFEGKDLGEIVKHVRGEPGSRARLVIVSKGDEEPKVVEIVRQTLKLPEDKPEEAEKGDDDQSKEKPHAFHFTIPGGGEFKGQLRLEGHPQAIRVGEQPLRLEIRTDADTKEKPADRPKADEKALPPAIDA